MKFGFAVIFLLALLVAISQAARGPGCQTRFLRVSDDLETRLRLVPETRVEEMDYNHKLRVGYITRDGTTAGGRLEISKEGIDWGTICGYAFGIKETKVACRLLGFSGDGWASSTANATYSDHERKIHLKDGSKCAGSETDLCQCSGNGNEKPCTHHTDVSLMCGPGQCENNLELTLKKHCAEKQKPYDQNVKAGVRACCADGCTHDEAYALCE